MTFCKHCYSENTADRLKCVQCQDLVCQACLANQDLMVCNNCYNNQCPICKKYYLDGLSPGQDYKECGICGKTICMDCLGITGCQTTWGICKECFDYKCQECRKDLVKNILYLNDCEPLPLCNECLVLTHN